MKEKRFSRNFGSILLRNCNRCFKVFLLSAWSCRISVRQSSHMVSGLVLWLCHPITHHQIMNWMVGSLPFGEYIREPSAVYVLLLTFVSQPGYVEKHFPGGIFMQCASILCMISIPPLCVRLFYGAYVLLHADYIWGWLFFDAQGMWHVCMVGIYGAECTFPLIHCWLRFL
jgi:hypothetical protein